MANITITKEEETSVGWEFGVNVDALDFQVKLTKEYYEALTDSRISPKDLVIKSFEFLLKKEPKESILRDFNIKDITKYFPEYEDVIS